MRHAAGSCVSSPSGFHTAAEERRLTAALSSEAHSRAAALARRFYPHYWSLLTGWADELIVRLPYPANQLCTDDFTG
eukprot:1294663-Pleurochrysis_carterae.AAC.1